jgi:hypothetical protein
MSAFNCAVYERWSLDRPTGRSPSNITVRYSTYDVPTLKARRCTLTLLVSWRGEPSGTMCTAPSPPEPPTGSSYVCCTLFSLMVSLLNWGQLDQTIRYSNHECFHSATVKYCSNLNVKAKLLWNLPKDWKRKFITSCKIWSFHGGDYEEWRLLGCYAV